MPVEACREGGRAGYRFGAAGACYTYEPSNEDARWRAKRKAERQGRAIHARRGLTGSEMVSAETYVTDYARWQIGASRVAELTAFMEAAFDERSAAERVQFEARPEVVLKFDVACGAAKQALAEVIATWTTEENSPKMEDGSLIIDSGGGAKTRLQQAILSYVNAKVTQIAAEVSALPFGPVREMALPMSAAETAARKGWDLESRTWQRGWAWFEEGMRDARVRLEAAIPARLVGEIDWDAVFGAAASEIDMTQMSPASCGCQLYNGALLNILKIYGYQGKNILGADELSLLSMTMECMVPEDLGTPWWKWGTEGE